MATRASAEADDRGNVTTVGDLPKTNSEASPKRFGGSSKRSSDVRAPGPDVQSSGGPGGAQPAETKQSVVPRLRNVPRERWSVSSSGLLGTSSYGDRRPGTPDDKGRGDKPDDGGHHRRPTDHDGTDGYVGRTSPHVSRHSRDNRDRGSADGGTAPHRSRSRDSPPSKRQK